MRYAIDSGMAANAHPRGGHGKVCHVWTGIPLLYQLLKSNPAERRELRPMCEAQMLIAKPNEVGLRGKGRIISPVDAVPLAAQHDLAMLF